MSFFLSALATLSIRVSLGLSILEANSSFLSGLSSWMVAFYRFNFSLDSLTSCGVKTDFTGDIRTESRL